MGMTLGKLLTKSVALAQMKNMKNPLQNWEQEATEDSPRPSTLYKMPITILSRTERQLEKRLLRVEFSPRRACNFTSVGIRSAAYQQEDESSMFTVLFWSIVIFLLVAVYIVRSLIQRRQNRKFDSEKTLRYHAASKRIWADNEKIGESTNLMANLDLVRNMNSADLRVIGNVSRK